MGRKALPLDDLEAIASARGGRFLGNGAIHTDKLMFSCENGHKWEARKGDVRAGKWCPICAASWRKDGIEDLRAHARSKGGECLSPRNLGSGKIHEWRCANGHEWFSTWHEIKRGKWCAACVRPGTLDTIEDMRAAARDQGGLCLEEEYKGSVFKCRWMCHEGHEWKARWGNVKAGSWCPECAKAKRWETRRKKG
jgi:hypothetical protein